VSRCEESYVTGHRRGEECPYKATNIIAGPEVASYSCGYHARAYAPRVVYPLEWSLETIRRFQRSNLDALLGGEASA
jgi:hypothetical protein